MVNALTGLFFAAAVAAAPQGPRPEPSEALFPPIEALLGEARAELPREEMLELRDALNDQPSQAAFMDALRSKDKSRRLSMIRAMGDTADVKAIPYLSAVLLKLDEDVDMRTAAAVSLGRVRHPLAKDYLVQASKDPSPEVRFAAVLGLGKCEEAGVATVLEDRLRKDPSWWVRYAVAIAMGRSRKAFAVTALQRATVEDSSWQVRMEAARALGEIGTPRAEEALAGSLQDTDSGVRAVAALALAQRGSERGISLLRTAFHSEQDLFMRSLLASAIKRALTQP